MEQSTSKAEKISQAFIKYCKSKNYQFLKINFGDNDLRLEISNLLECTKVMIYHTGRIVMGGKENSLKNEINHLKKEIETNPQDFFENNKTIAKGCATIYNIIIPELRKKIKEALDTLEEEVKIDNNPKEEIEYRAKIIRNIYSLTLTQFKSGTLLLQGKTDKLFSDTCDEIEKIANPADKEVIARFISSDEKNLEIFTARYSQQLIFLAETNVKRKLCDVYDYIESHDQKWFVASECLCLAKIPLPEFSPLVMPASKAFEGFVKKILVGIGLFDTNHFKKKNAKFSFLYDNNDKKRKDICEKNKYAETYLKKIGVCLDTNRNFMMHSDDSKVTKVETQEEAEEKVNSIFKDTKEIFIYFNDLYNLMPT